LLEHERYNTVEITSVRFTLTLQKVVISDYPATVVLDNIQRNAKAAVPSHLASRYSVEGFEWGDLDSAFAKKYAGHFDRIIAADCFWMPSQHFNLVHSMLHLLKRDASSRVLAIGGFHTGRAKLAGFFDVATEEGLEVEEIYEEDIEGTRKEWLKERDGGRQDVTGRKRWLVVATLKHGRLRELN
jgi:EEF1A N-terminal glycine/lysine methyltransferase